MTINDRVFSIALLEGSSLDEVTKTTIANMARNKGSGRTETRMNPAILEQKLPKITINEKQTTNNE